MPNRRHRRLAGIDLAALHALIQRRPELAGIGVTALLEGIAA